MYCNPNGQQVYPINCVPTAPPPEAGLTYNPYAPQPPQYGSLYPPLPSATQVQQIKDYVKSQVKAESLRRAGIQGSDPWGDAAEAIGTPAEEQQMPAGSAVPITTQIPGLLAPPVGLIDPAVLSQPQGLINYSKQNGADGSPQLVNSEVTYFAPHYSTTSHRECVNCCEDCCEDICENCFLNCCLDCSKVTNAPKLLLDSLMTRLGLSGNNGQYALMGNGIPLNPLTGLPINPATGLPINPMTGLPMGVCPIHAMTGCPTPLTPGCLANIQVVCPIHAMTGCPTPPAPCCPTNPLNNSIPLNPLTGCPLTSGNTIGNISSK